MASVPLLRIPLACQPSRPGGREKARQGSFRLIFAFWRWVGGRVSCEKAWKAGRGVIAHPLPEPAEKRRCVRGAERGPCRAPYVTFPRSQGRTGASAARNGSSCPSVARSDQGGFTAHAPRGRRGSQSRAGNARHAATHAP